MELAKRGLVSAMIDVSDGLLADLGHLLEQSGQGGKLFLRQLPLSAEYLRRSPVLSDDRFTFALSGGEDYELLFTSPPERREEIRDLSASLQLPITAIGEIHEEPALVVIAPDGSTYTPGSRGFDHFA